MTGGQRGIAVNTVLYLYVLPQYPVSQEIDSTLVEKLNQHMYLFVTSVEETDTFYSSITPPSVQNGNCKKC